MKAFVVFECFVPDHMVSESLDFHVGAIDQLRDELKNNGNPCAYGSGIVVLTQNEIATKYIFEGVE